MRTRHGRLLDHDARVLGMRRAVGHVAAHVRLEQAPVVHSRGDLRIDVDGGVDALEQEGDRLPPQLLFGAADVTDHAVIDARLGGNAADRGALEAVAGEVLECGVEYGGAGVFQAPAPGRRGPWRGALAGCLASTARYRHARNHKPLKRAALLRPAGCRGRLHGENRCALVEFYRMTEGGGTCVLFADQFPDKLHTVVSPRPGTTSAPSTSWAESCRAARSARC